MNNLFFQREFKIIHIDMDCFYAAVEMRDDPKLRGIPLGIGGPSKTKGVLCTSNYEARKFGVKAALPTFKAFQLCPHLTLVAPNFYKYEEVSTQIREIFYKYTDLVEPLSLDEAYLDVTHSKHFGGSATLIAKAIQEEIFKVTGLTASAGVSFNKMLAKIASDWKKPSGLFTITPKQRLDFIKDLPLRKIPGIGKVSSERMERMGLVKCQDVLDRDLFDLIPILGKRSALDLYEACQGISNSKVTTRSKRKSFGIERTFYESISQIDDIREEYKVLVKKYNKRFLNIDPFHTDDQEISHISVKIRFADFTTFTKDVAIDYRESDELLKHKKLTIKSTNILLKIFEDMHESHKKEIRLIGIGIKFRKRTLAQMNLLEVGA